MKFINLKKKLIGENKLKKSTIIGVIGYGIQGRSFAKTQFQLMNFLIKNKINL